MLYAEDNNPSADYIKTLEAHGGGEVHITLADYRFYSVGTCENIDLDTDH